jgi:2-oxoglutarate dehydrogenase complex dehydrogenase (E1) component-like enzyme
VNGDDPEAVVFAAKVATEYRQLFGKDVVIDMFCYRRFGHNEGDDPTMTQPLMYQKIKGHPSVRELYASRLVGEGVVTQAKPTAGSPSSRLPRPGVRQRQGLSRRQGRLAGRQVVGPAPAGR